MMPKNETAIIRDGSTVNNHGSVVITGTSTGIGRATALALDHLGFHVFAGVRKETDAKSLANEASSRLTPVFLDVTDTDSIAKVREQVAETVGEDGLAGLINNAGVLFNGPLEFISLEDLRQQFEVNVFGDIAVTQAFLALIRKGKGRIVNVGSVAGKFAAPFFSPLSASKFAMESFTDALRLELHPWKIPVVLIQPGFVDTAATGKVEENSAAMLKKLSPEGVELYGETFRRRSKEAIRGNVKGIPAEEVASVIVKALMVAKPKIRYAVGLRARVTITLARLLPDRVLDWIRIRMFGL